MKKERPEPDVEIDNIGPIEHVEFSLPKGGGIVVFRGRNGVGKTQALEAVDKLTTGRGGLSVRDNQRRGTVAGLGMNLYVGGNTRRKGELSVEVLDSQLSLSDLVDPHLKSVAAADAKRIKTLVALSGAKPDIALFRDLVDESTFETHVVPTASKADDLITQAASVKRSIESVTRVIEGLRDKARSNAEAHAAAVGDVDVSEAGSIDAIALQATLQSAIETKSRLRAEQNAADSMSDTLHKARTELATARENYTGLQVAEARECVNTAAKIENKAADQLHVAQESERAAIQTANEATAEYRVAKEKRLGADGVLEGAKAHTDDIAAWRKTIDDSESLPSPTAADIAEAATTLTEAQAAYDRIAVLRTAQAAHDRANEATAEYEERKAEAERLREAARGTDDVLSDVVATLGVPIKVQADRLYVTTKRGQTPFCELSMGERWKMAIDIAVAVAPEQALFPVPQEGWEGLDPINRSAVLASLKKHHIWIATAEASADDGIVASEYRKEDDE